jgi:hypothetical protein
LSTLILFTDCAPHPFTEELSRQGHQVFEAIAISEVYALADQHANAAIIITANVLPELAKAIQHHYPTMHLKANATVQDILWELNLRVATGRSFLGTTFSCLSAQHW